MIDNKALIRVEGLCKNFGSLEVLEGIDTEIQKGEYFAIKTDKLVRRGDRIFLLKVEE